MKHARPFTGWHMTAILVAGFAVVIAVNMAMATIAVRSFGGTVVENSYVASQKFNGWLAQARAQEKLGWRDRVTLDPARHVRMELNVRGAQMSAVAKSTASSISGGIRCWRCRSFRASRPYSA